MDETDRFGVAAVAIIGMAGRFPGARTLAAFWQNLLAGREALQATAAAPNQPDHVAVAAPLDEVDRFDADFFAINPRDAEIMDPQHRLFLECAWEALEDAGCVPGRGRDLIGVFGAAGVNGYLQGLLAALAGSGADPLAVKLGNDKDYLASRVSYKLNLKGPSLSVQSACSSSLVAVHMACQSLATFECDVALAGGVSLDLAGANGYVYKAGSIFSPDGHCRPFDARAAGTVSGSGVGIVVLKRYADAIRDGDEIDAVILGSAINNDGADKAFYTAPSIEGHAFVVDQALTIAGVEANTIGYIEAHGTGTPIGDPIEIEALTTAFRRHTGACGFCGIGSVKSNIGHLDVAAGIAGLIKTVLALKHGIIPASLNWSAPNPKIDFAGSPFYVNAASRPWPDQSLPRRAGVSSLGMGGTNAHVVLEAPPAIMPDVQDAGACVLPLSGRTPAALDAATRNCRDLLRRLPPEEIGRAVHTYQVGRKAFAHRRVVVAGSAAQLVGRLDSLSWTDRAPRSDDAPDPRVAFIFPGQGTQFVGMAGELYRTERLFRAEIDRCCELLAVEFGLDPRVLLLADGKGSAGGDGSAAEQLRQTEMAQPALFVVEYALARLWMAWSVAPAAMVGHSVGEYVAACIAGVFDPDDALRLIVARARAMQLLPGGAMLAVDAPEAELRGLLGDAAHIAAVNAPTMCVAAGATEAIDRLAQRLAATGIAARRLAVSHAFHTPQMQPARETLRAALARITLRPPQIPFMSNVSGGWITADEATDPDYWASHLVQTVRFGDNLATLAAAGNYVCIEAGPGQSGAVCLAATTGKAAAPVLPSLARQQEALPDSLRIRQSLGELWLHGLALDWGKISFGSPHRKLHVPTYPFERQRYWLQGQTNAALAAAPSSADPAAALSSADPQDWLYTPAWKQSPAPLASSIDRGEEPRLWRWLVIGGPARLAASLAGELQERGHLVALAGDDEPDGGRFVRRVALGSSDEEDTDRMLTELLSGGFRPDRIVDLRPVGSAADGSPTPDRAAATFGACVNLIQALGRYLPGQPVGLHVITDRAFNVVGEPALDPSGAVVLGPCRVARLEYPNLQTRCIDVSYQSSPWPSPQPSPDGDARLASWLACEMASEHDLDLVAWRGGQRFAMTYDRQSFAWPAEHAGIRRGGTYLITGGFGTLGLTVARHLAELAQANLVLIGRTGLPPRETWQEVLADQSADAEIRARLLAVREIERAGGTVLACAADVAVADELAGVVEQAHRCFGSIHGAVHAAGVASGGLMQARRLAEMQRVLHPKIAGACNLLDCLAPHQPDFILLFSSATALTGGLGQADYCAANAFMDSLAQACTQGGIQGSTGSGAANVTSINWGAWQLDSWTARGLAALPELQARMAAGRQAFGIGAAEGCRVLSLLTQVRAPQVIVSRQPIEAARQAEIDLAAGVIGAHAATTGLHERRLAPDSYVAPRGELERQVAAIWQDILGIAQVGVEDDFIALGGHSLLAVQLATRIREQFQASIELRELIEQCTVAKLAAILSCDRAPAIADAEFTSILQAVEELSEEAVEAALAELEGRSHDAVTTA